MQRVLEPIVRQALGMTMAGLKQNNDLSTKEVAFVIASNFALCTAPAVVDVDWSKVPSYITEKEHGLSPWFANQLFGPVFAQMSPPPADVHKYCVALLLPLLRASASLGSELVANKVENHFVKGELLDTTLLPSVVAALGETHKVTAADVAAVMVQHFLPLVHGAPCKLNVLRALFGVMACSVAQAPSDSSTEFVSLPMMLSEKLLAGMVSAVEDATDPALHLAAVHVLNAALRLPQAVYLLRLKQHDWSCLFKYCVDLVGGRTSQRCVASLAITTALRFMNCDTGTITISKKSWVNSRSLEMSVLTPFISGCVPPQVALAFASRMIACSCDMQAPQPTADDASGLRLSSIVSLFTGYAALAHLRAPFDWLQHANGVVSFWGARFGVDGDGVLQSLKDLKDSCSKAHAEGVYTLHHLVPLFFHVLQQLHVTVAYTLNIQGDEADDCTALNDAAAPVMAWACDVSSLASAPAVAACFFAFASFSRQRCLDTDIVNMFASLKRFGQGAGGGELLSVCKDIAAKLTDDGVETVDVVFPKMDAVMDAVHSDSVSHPESHDAGDSLQAELNIDYEPGAADDEEFGGSGGSPLAATPPSALHGASPLIGEDDQQHYQPLSNFVHTVPLHAMQPLPLFAQSPPGIYPSYSVAAFGGVQSLPGVYAETPDVNVDSAFTEVVTGLNSSTAQLVKRAQHRHRQRQAGVFQDDASHEANESGEVEGQFHIPHALQSHSRGPASFTFMSETAAEEALAANKAIVERLASIESMLSKLATSNRQISVAQDAESLVQNSAEFLPQNSAEFLVQNLHGFEHDGDSGMSSPPLSERSHQSNIASTLPEVQRTVRDSLKPNKSKNTSNAAAEAAARYLKSAAAASAAPVVSEPSVPDDTATMLNLRQIETKSLHVATPTSDSKSVPGVKRTNSATVHVNRESLQKAMHAISGLRNSADLTGATAAAVNELLKANSGNPLHGETFDPLVIGDTLEAFEAFLYSVYSTDMGGDEEEQGPDSATHFPSVMTGNLPMSGRMRDGHEAAEGMGAIDVPPMKDMTVPDHRRESIHMDQFLAPGLVQFMHSSSQYLDKSHYEQPQQQYQQQPAEQRHVVSWDGKEESTSNSVASSADHEAEDPVQISDRQLASRAAQDPELQQQFDSVPMLSGDLDAMHEAYTTAISQLTSAMANVRHVLQPPAVSEDKTPPPSVNMWNREEEQDFILRPRKDASQNDERRGSSWSWFVA